MAMPLLRAGFCNRSRSVLILAFEPVVGDGDDADVHGAAVDGEHGGFDLDAGAVGAECGMRMIGGGRFVSGREHYHLSGMAVDKVNAAREIVAYGPASVGRAVDVPEAAAGLGLTDDDHFAGAKIYDA